MTKQPLIHIEKLNVTYFAGRSNEVRALKNISLDIFPSEFIIFFGPSGCGKSTLLYAIAGLERNIEGHIIVKDKDISTMKKQELEEYHQRVVGMIFQSFYLIASLSVIENVALPQIAMGIDKDTRQAVARDLLKNFGVAEQADKLPTELSGGQQQRVAICRSVVNDPDILVADEPVGNLDSKSSEDVMKLLRKLNDEQKKTVILVTHDPSHLRHAHRIYFLKDGEIIGTKENTEAERQKPLIQQETQSAASNIINQWLPTSADTHMEPEDGPFILKAQQILAETLTGMTVDELTHLETHVLHCLRERKTDPQEIVEYLHQSPSFGGIGMNILRAKKLATDIAGIVDHMVRMPKKKHVQGSEAPATTKPPQVSRKQEHEIRRYLLDTLNIDLKALAVVPIIDAIILKRLKGKIDRLEVQRLLHLPMKDGGAGMDIRIARKLSRLLETLSPEFPIHHATS